jgi:hypothetical protein
LACGADYLNPAASVELYVGASAPSAFWFFLYTRDPSGSLFFIY